MYLQIQGRKSYINIILWMETLASMINGKVQITEEFEKRLGSEYWKLLRGRQTKINYL